MDFSLNEIQEVFKSTAHRFLKEKCTVAALKSFEESEYKYNQEIYSEIAKLGFLGLIIPEEYGGVGGSLLDLAVVIEEAGWGTFPSPLLSTISYGVLPLLSYGTEEQKQNLLPKIAAGEVMFSGALSEQQAHYDLSYINAFAEKSGEHYSLSGKKLFVSFAESANYFLTLARTNETSKGHSLFLVKDEQKNTIQTSPISVIGTDSLYEVDFQKVVLSKEDLLGEVNNGMTMMGNITQMATAFQCVEMVGVLRKALDVTNDYVKERKQFGRPIGSYQSVQHRLSDMLTIVEGGRLAAYHAISKLEAGLPAEREVSIAKAWLSKKGQEVLVGAHQLHGGMGIDLDYPLQYCFRRFKNMQLSLGTAPIHLKKIADSLDLQFRHEGLLHA